MRMGAAEGEHKKSARERRPKQSSEDSQFWAKLRKIEMGVSSESQYTEAKSTHVSPNPMTAREAMKTPILVEVFGTRREFEGQYTRV